MVALKRTLLSVKQIVSGNLPYDAGKSNLVFCDNLQGKYGVGDGRDVHVDVGQKPTQY